MSEITKHDQPNSRFHGRDIFREIGRRHMAEIDTSYNINSLIPECGSSLIRQADPPTLWVPHRHRQSFTASPQKL